MGDLYDCVCDWLSKHGLCASVIFKKLGDPAEPYYSSMAVELAGVLNNGEPMDPEELKKDVDSAVILSKLDGETVRIVACAAYETQKIGLSDGTSLLATTIRHFGVDENSTPDYMDAFLVHSLDLFSRSAVECLPVEHPLIADLEQCGKKLHILFPRTLVEAKTLTTFVMVMNFQYNETLQAFAREVDLGQHDRCVSPAFSDEVVNEHYRRVTEAGTPDYDMQPFSDNAEYDPEVPDCSDVSRAV